MKKIILFIFLLSNLTFIHAQDNTYLKTFYEFGEIRHVVEDQDENIFVLNRLSLTHVKITKLSKDGEFIAETEPFASESLLNQGNFVLFKDSLLICHHSSSTFNGVRLRVFDKNCQFIEDIVLPELNGFRFFEVLASEENILLYLASPANNLTIAFSSNWPEINWVNESEFQTNVFKRNYVSLNENGEVLTSYYNLYHTLYTNSGDMLLKDTIEFHTVSNIAADGFYIHNYLGVLRYNFEGGLSSDTLAYVSGPNKIFQMKDNNLGIIKEDGDVNYFQIYDPNFNEKQTIDLAISNLSQLKITDSKYFYVWGSNFSNAVLQKVHPDGHNSFVNLRIYPEYIYEPGHYTYLHLNSNDFEELDIYYSQDRVHWTPIEENLRSNDWNYKWYYPGGFEKLYIKVQASIDSRYKEISWVPLKFEKMLNNSDVISANNIQMWTTAGGKGSHDPGNDDCGLFWDGTSNPQIPAVFADGPVFGFKSSGELKVYSAGYYNGFVPGVIYDDGSFTPPDTEAYNVFQIAKGWQEMPAGEDKVKFEYSYKNWPAELGAPFHDMNNNSTYDPPADRPAFSGDRTLWFASHTADSAVTAKIFGSYGDKMEIQTKVWAENSSFTDVIFKEYNFINKDQNSFEDFYFGYWADPDLGNPVDDFAGVDTKLNMAYCYNGDSFDEEFYGSNPAAIGYLLLDGPIVPATLNDTARYREELRPGYKNLTLSASGFFINGESFYDDPTYGSSDGAPEMYNNLRGLNFAGESYEIPGTSETTKFPLSGDPVRQSGWYEGNGWSGGPEPGDRRILLSSGPFELAPADTQNVIIAILLARDSSPEGSITKLKTLAGNLKSMWESGQITGVNQVNENPEDYQLSQNYPNPFNPVTTIEFSLPEQANVKLEVFNILGEKVTELVNTQMKAGNHKVNFDASALSSGVYLYSLKAGNTNLTRKMVVLK